jgi:hypothetical protein
MTDPREMFRSLQWPYPGNEFPAHLGAVVQLTVANGDRPAREVTHWADGSWTVGDGIDDPNVPGAVTVTHIAHAVAVDPSIRSLATMPPGHIAHRSSARRRWRIYQHVDSED